uniref:Transcription factor TFIIIC triple barrel domain-containing protein n=1 Tax=Romanomermis culicivorax TaxID=13658 RepID=A0A915HF64_ROMCU
MNSKQRGIGTNSQNSEFSKKLCLEWTNGDLGGEIKMTENGPNQNDDEYEEVTFAAELNGLFDEQYVQDTIAKGQIFVHRLDDEKQQPVIQIGTQLFLGQWEHLLGTDLIFTEAPKRHLLNFAGMSDKRLVAQQVLLLPKEKDEGEQEKGEEAVRNAEFIEESLHAALNVPQFETTDQ